MLSTFYFLFFFSDKFFAMAPPSFDFSCLFCTEDSSILDENDLGGSMEDETEQFDEPVEYVPPPLLPPPLLSEENLKVLIEKECHHLPASDYVNRLKNGELDLQGRMESIDWMEKVGPTLICFIVFSLYFSFNSHKKKVYFFVLTIMLVHFSFASSNVMCIAFL